jgi:hypothetical protein
MQTIKSLAFVLALLTPLFGNAATIFPVRVPSIELNNKTNIVSDNGNHLTYNGTNMPLSPEVASSIAAGLIANTNVSIMTITNAIFLGPTTNTFAFIGPTNDLRSPPYVPIAPTFAAITNVLGFVPATNGVDVPKAGGTMTGPLAPPQYAYANLPSASANTGAIVWCTDAYTPYRLVGGDFYSDGTNWISLGSKIVATTSLNQFMINSIGWIGDSKVQSGRHATHLGTGNFSEIGSTSIGTGALDQSSEAGRSYGAITTSTSASGAAAIVGPNWTPQAGEIWQVAWEINLSGVADDTEKYYTALGFGANYGSLGNDGAWFLYDRPNATSYLGTGYNTNNLWMISRASSANSTNMTTIAASSFAGAGNWLRIVLQKSTTYDVFWTNGVVAWSNTVNVTSAKLNAPRFNITKTGGTVNKQVNITWADSQYRRATPLVWQ